MNKSLAIWYSPREEGDERPQLDLHFNFWKLKNTKGSDKGIPYFLDIGLMVSNITLTKDIFIYFPFILSESKDEIINLGKLIANRKLLASIFNERAEIKSVTDESHPAREMKEIHKLTEANIYSGNEKKDEFLIYNFDNDDFEIQNFQNGEKGSILKFNVEKSYFEPEDQPEKVYFRFRLNLTPGRYDAFISESTPWDRWFLSSVNKKEFLDFRINEKRNIPEKLQDEKVDRFFKNKKVHFFHMRTGDDDLIVSGKNFSGCRELEDEIWNKYVNYKNGGSITLNKVFAYHWKEDISEDNRTGFSTAAKFQCQESSFVSWLRNFLWLLVVSFVGGIAAVLFMGLIQNNTNEEANPPVLLNKGETRPPLTQPLKEESPQPPSREKRKTPQPPLQGGEN